MPKTKHLILTLLSSALLSTSALALTSKEYTDTIVVNSASDTVTGCPGAGCTLRAAILQANSQAGPILIQIADGINPSLYLAGTNENAGESGDLDITGYVDIEGLGSSAPNRIDANLLDRVFHIRAGAKVEMFNVEILGGLIEDPETTIDSAGGAFYVDGSSELILEDVVVRDNSAPVGGAILNLGRLEIRSGAYGTTRIYNNEGINYNAINPELPIDPADLEPDPSQVDQNIPGYGGAIANFGGTMFIGGVVIENNFSGVGGAIYNASAGLTFGNAIITNSELRNNVSLTHGGAIANLGPMSINNSALTGNRSNANEKVVPSTTELVLGDGGAIFNSGTASLDLTNVTISGNRARAGGGIFNSRDITLTNVTLYDNSAVPCSANCTETSRSQMGGQQLAIYDTDNELGLADPNVTLSNTVISNNSGETTSGSACAAWGNLASPPPTALQISQQVIPGFVSSSGGNFDNDDTCGLGNSSSSYTDIAGGGDPMLGILQINEPADAIGQYGTTPTHHPDSGSPLIDNGNGTCPGTDQRFLARLDGACDIGALEVGATQGEYGNVVDLAIELNDSPDPVAANDDIQQLTYTVATTNLYEGPSAYDVLLEITLDPSVNINWISSSECAFSLNTISCTIPVLHGLQRVEYTINTTPTQDGTIAATATILGSSFPDAFEANDSDTEYTTVDSTIQGPIINFGGSGGGGVANAWGLLALAGLMGLRRRRRRG